MFQYMEGNCGLSGQILLYLFSTYYFSLPAPAYGMCLNFARQKVYYGILLPYLSTTALCVAFHCSLSVSVPMSGFSFCKLTPATLAPLQTGTENKINKG